MKKRLLVLGLAFTMLAATACGTSSDGGNKTSKADKTVTATSNSDKTSETQKKDDKKDDAKENYKSADDITMDDLKNHEETSAEDFEYGDGPNGSIVIDGYIGDDPIVVIPNEIDGKKVVDFGKTFTNNKDIIAIKISTLSFIEVKSRFFTSFGKPIESITHLKQLKIINSAKYYIFKNNLYNHNIQFDVIEIIFDLNNTNYDLNHIKDAFRLY